MDSCTEIKSDVTKSGRVWRKVPESDARGERGGMVTVLGAGCMEGRGLGMGGRGCVTRGERHRDVSYGTYVTRIS